MSGNLPSPPTHSHPDFSRRGFLKMAGGVGSLATLQGMVNLFSTQEARASGESSRRNIILFTTDQQQELRWFPDGWEAANLPALTRLRNKGVSFTRAYTNTAMCTPARATLFTGLYPAQHLTKDTLSEGMEQSEEEHQLDPSIPNLCSVLQAEGYDVVWKGKWHLSKGTDHPDGSHSQDDIARYGAGQWNGPDAGGDAKIKNYGGGDTNHDGRFFDGSTWQDPTGDPMDPNYIFSQADGPLDPEFEAQSVMSFLRHKIDNPGGNPFCLIICLINPHDVLGCPGLPLAIPGANGTYIQGGYFGREDNSSPWSEQTGPLAIGVPPTAAEDLVGNLKPTCQDGFVTFSQGLGPVGTNNRKLEYLNFYANLIKLNDRRLEKMLNLLDGVDETVSSGAATGLRDNSWMIFLSDHGDMTMSHGGMRQKSFECYEENANIPLIWSNPVEFPTGAVCNELVSHVDFMPTLCTVLGIDPAPYSFKGVSYASLLQNPAGPAVQSSVLFTFDDIWSGQDAAGKPNGVVDPPNRLRALIDKDYKIVHYFDGNGVAAPQEEFYDLRSSTDGGTDTDLTHGFGSVGHAVEYLNYAPWAEVQRTVPIATPALQTAYATKRAELETAIATKLAPRVLPPAEAPKDFEAKLYRWLDDNEQPMSSVQLTWMSRCNTRYQLKVSTDLVKWDDLGDPVQGNNGPMWIDQTISGKAFFRLEWIASPEAPLPQPDLS